MIQGVVYQYFITMTRTGIFQIVDIYEALVK